jgi:hypothetical protein
MRCTILSCLAILASAASASAQSAPSQTSPTPPPTLQAKNPAYDIRTFSDLVHLCSTDRSDPSYPGAVGLCSGYISGVLDYHLVDTGWSGGRRSRRVCLPAEPVTRMETLQSLVSWDRSNQKYNDDPAAEGVMRYFMATYPCRTPRSAGSAAQPHG